MKQYHHKQNSLLVSQLANLMSVTGYICTLENYQQKEENIHTFFFGGGGGGEVHSQVYSLPLVSLKNSTSTHVFTLAAMLSPCSSLANSALALPVICKSPCGT